MNAYMAKQKLFAFQKPSMVTIQLQLYKKKPVLCNKPFDEDAMSFPMAYNVALHTLTNT